MFSILIVFSIVSIFGAHLLNENNKIRNLITKDDNSFRVRLTLLDIFENKNKHYISVMTKYGYTLWAFYVVFEIFNSKMNTISIGLSDLLLKYYLNK